MLKIRLMRIGAKKRPFYRVVVVDERAKRTGAYIELLGSYNPLTEPKDIQLKQDRIDHWVKQGAQLSDGFLRITGKAPQRPPRKPKKEKKEETAKSVSENSENSESQNIGKSENQNQPENQEKQTSDTSETPTESGTPSNSESSEESEKNK